MIIRKLSPLVLFSICLIGTLFTAHNSTMLILIFCPAIIAAGCGITLLVHFYHSGNKEKKDRCPGILPGFPQTESHYPDTLPGLKTFNSFTWARAGLERSIPGLKTFNSFIWARAGLFLIIISLGISFGLSLAERINTCKQSVYTGIELSRVSSFTGKCALDSSTGKNNTFIHYIDLITVHSQTLQAQGGAKGRVMVVADNGKRLYTGEMVTITGTLSATDRTPDIHYQCWVKQDHIRRTGFSGTLFRIRKDIHSRLMTHISEMGYPASSLFEALFLGNRDNLPDELYRGFEKTGTLHILALSGLHVGILYGSITLLLFFLPGKWLKYGAGFCAILFYLFLVGPRPSLLRASVMLIIFGTGYLLSLERDPLNLLAIAAVIILMIDPFSAFSLSFHLSFLALLGIFIIGRPVTWFFKAFLPTSLSLPLAFSIGAQAGTTPIVLSTFGIIYPSGIIVTLLLLPLVTVYLIGGIVYLVLITLPFSFIKIWGKLFFSFLYKVIVEITSLFSHIPGLPLVWKQWYWGLFFIFCIPFLCNIRRIHQTIFKKVT